MRRDWGKKLQAEAEPIRRSQNKEIVKHQLEALDFMGRMGRPTDHPKDIVLKVYFDKETAAKLDECMEELEVSKSEVVRRGIHKVHNGLKKK